MNRRLCNACGFAFHDVTPTCAECGAQLSLSGHRDPARSRRFKSSGGIGRWPWLSIAFGPDSRSKFGRASGIVAIGDDAIGVVAIGLRATGLIAMGGFCRGFLSVGVASIGLASSGVLAAGGLAVGGVAFGYFAKGSVAIGCFASGGHLVARFARTGDGPLPDGLPGILSPMSWVFQGWPMAVTVGIMLLAVLPTVLLVLLTTSIRASRRR